MRASKSWNFDLEKPIESIKMDSCVIFADHCTSGSPFVDKRERSFQVHDIRCQRVASRQHIDEEGR